MNVLLGFLLSTLAFPPLIVRFITQTPSASVGWRLAKPVWEMDPTKANQSNLLINQERKTHIQKASPYTLFQCES